MKSAFALAFCALALLAGCSGNDDETEPACEAKLVDYTYACYDIPRYDGDNGSLLKRGEPLQGCSDLLDTLPDGAYWWAKTDSTGEGVYGRVFIGKDSWMQDGSMYGNRMYGYRGYCMLDSIGADSTVAGTCVSFVQGMEALCHFAPTDSADGEGRWNMQKCDLHVMSCGTDMCTFVFPRDPVRHLDEIEGLDCINRHKTQQQMLDSLAVDSTAVAVTMNDSIVEIKVLDAKMTWTKRPGL